MRIFLDAGHNYSGGDTGATGNGLREQDITFYVADYLRKMLADVGVTVKMSREKITDNLGTDLNSSLAVRANMSDYFNADVCISIHCNASTNSTARGTETYIYQTGGQAEPLAKKVNTALVGLGLVNRGVKTANFYMVRKPKAPAILIEMAFISNADDAKVLRDKQKELAAAIFGAICEQYGIGKEDEPKMIYNYVDANMPEWARQPIQNLVDKGYLKGNEKGELGLNDDMLRILVILTRAGVFR